jgi:hypothetical protein
VPFDVFTIRAFGDSVGDRLYPDLNDDPSNGPVQLEPTDGIVRMHWVATGLSVARRDAQRWKVQLELDEVHIDCFLTDSRAFFACPNYKKSGGYAGIGLGMAIAVAANAVSRARTAAQTRSTALVGHIRHDWTISVGGQSKWWIVPGSVRFLFHDGDQTRILDLKVPKATDPHAIALHVARVAAAFRLTNHANLSPEQRAGLTALSVARPLTNPKNRFANHQLPHAFKVL